MWLQELVNECKIQCIAHNDLAVIIDNIPAHCRAKEIAAGNPGMQAIRF